MTARRIVTPYKYIGLSSDTKPTDGATPVRPGTTFYEYDTDLMFITYDGDNWVLKRDSTDLSNWRFGEPVLEAGGDGRASWTTTAVKGSNQVTWAAKLDAGKQTSWNDFAKVVIPVNEMPFTDIDSIRIQAYYTATSGIDMGVCIYMHDPDDLDQRMELSHTPYTTSAAGWRELNFPTEPGGTSWFWYGNVTAETPDTCPTSGTAYTWANFQADSVFSTWKVYKITLDYGYYTGNGVMDGCYLVQCLINGEAIQIQPSVREMTRLTFDTTANAVQTIPAWTFGEPELRYNKNSIAYWSRGSTSPRLQKSSTGWQACLHGRVQSGDDWAAVYIPVNELPVTSFETAQWSYYMTAAETMGVNIVLWVHDPDDFDKRAEITQVGGTSGLEKALGWNAHEFSTSTTQMFFYGENTTGTALTAGTQYTWDQFQADALFSVWTIYRISLEYGWEASGTFDQVWLADLMLNGTNIPLKPRTDADLAPIHTYYTGSSDITTGNGTVAPKTPFKLLSVSLHLDANPGEAAAYTIQVLRDNDKHATYYDTVLHYSDLYVPTTATSRHVIFGEGYEFAEDDVIDILWDGNSKNYGLVITWKPM